MFGLKNPYFAMLMLVLATGCTSTSVTPLAANVVSITTSAAPVCGGQGAQKVASQQAALETVRRGFDKFMIINSQGSNNIRQIGTTPIYANTTATGSAYGNSVYINGTTNVYGGEPIYGGSHDREIVVAMFKNDDPQGQNGLDARSVIGPDWEKKIAQTKSTCFE